jgi:WD40 repeat protein
VDKPSINPSVPTADAPPTPESVPAEVSQSEAPAEPVAPVGPAAPRKPARTLRAAVALSLLAVAGLCSAWAMPRCPGDAGPAVPPLLDGAPFERFGQTAGGLPEVLATLSGPEGKDVPGPTFAVSPDGEWIAAADGPSVLLWRAGSTTASIRLDGFPGHVRALAFSADTKALAVGGRYTEGMAGWFQCWNVGESEFVAGNAVTETLGVNALAFVGTVGDDDGTGRHRLAVGGVPVDRLEGGDVKEGRHRLQLYRVSPTQCTHLSDLGESTTAIAALAASRDGRTLAARDEMGDVQVWSFGREPAPKFIGWVAAAALLAAAGCAVGGLWRLATGVVVVGLACCGALWGWHAFQGEQYLLGTLAAAPARGLSCSADGSLVAAGEGRKVRLWRREGSSLLELDPVEGHSEPVVAVAFSPAGPWLATLDKGGELRVTHLPGGEQVRHVKGLTGEEVTLSPDGRHALAGGGQMAILRLWDFESEKAQTAADEAVARDPNDPDAREQRARVALRQGRHKDAVADLTAALARRPSKEAHWLRASAHAALDDLDAALKDLDAVIEADDKDALAHLQRGMLLMKRKRYGEARQSLDKAFRLDPSLEAAAPAGAKP